MVGLCLAGFVAAIRVTSLLDMAMLRNTFVTSLARFTNLHAPASMEPKSAKAFRALLFVADDVGNHLHVRARPSTVNGLSCSGGQHASMRLALSLTLQLE